MNLNSCVRAAVAAGGFIAVAGLSTMASAVGFSGSYAINALNSDPGLLIETQELADPLNFVLNAPGDMYKVNLFKIWTDETYINSDDQMQAGISVDFDFTAPPSTGSVTGTSVGGSVLIFSGGKVEWDGPSVIEFGDGGKLQISLSDETFNVGLFGNTTPGWKHGAKVEAKFTLLSEPVEQIPLPAAMPLLVSALGGMFLFRRRSRVEA